MPSFSHCWILRIIHNSASVEIQMGPESDTMVCDPVAAVAGAGNFGKLVTIQS